MFAADWEAIVRVRYDANIFSIDDIRRLMARAGVKQGIGEDRPGSLRSTGLGWGTFKVV